MGVKKKKRERPEEERESGECERTRWWPAEDEEDKQERALLSGGEPYTDK